jgi:cytochrome b561
MSKVAGYSRAQIALHWGVLALLVVSFLSREGMGEAFRAAVEGKAIETATLATLHRVVGIAVLVLALARIGLRFRHGAPAQSRQRTGQRRSGGPSPGRIGRSRKAEAKRPSAHAGRR